MKTPKPRHLAAAVLLCALAAVLTAATFRIRDYPVALTLNDTNIFEMAAAGVTNYQVSFGTLASNIAGRAAGQTWTANQTFVSTTNTGTLTVNGTIYSAVGPLSVEGAQGLRFVNRGRFCSQSIDGDFYISNFAGNNFIKLSFGGLTAAFPAIGRTNGDLLITSGAGAFSGAITNRLLIPGGIVLGLTGSTLTNLSYASATLDFPSTSTGTCADLPITLAGAADGDIVTVGAPSGSCTGIAGSYSAFSSNGAVFVRFTPTAATQNPASGLFKVSLEKYLP